MYCTEANFSAFTFKNFHKSRLLYLCCFLEVGWFSRKKVNNMVCQHFRHTAWSRSFTRSSSVWRPVVLGYPLATSVSGFTFRSWCHSHSQVVTIFLLFCWMWPPGSLFDPFQQQKPGDTSGYLSEWWRNTSLLTKEMWMKVMDIETMQNYSQDWGVMLRIEKKKNERIEKKKEKKWKEKMRACP